MSNEFSLSKYFLNLVNSVVRIRTSIEDKLFKIFVNQQMEKTDRQCIEFRNYLESSGAISALTNVLVKLHDLEEKPQNSIEFLRANLDPQTTVSIEELQVEVANLRREIGELKRPTCKVEDVCDRDYITNAFEALQRDDMCNSLLKQCLTQELIAELSDIKTSKLGFTLFDCIKLGLDDCTCAIGVTAADAECYITFARLFDCVVMKCHDEYSGTAPPSNWTEHLNNLTNPDSEGIFVQNGEITCRRSLDLFPFPENMNEAQLLESMEIIREAFHHFDSTELKGTFHVLDGIDENIKSSLFNEKLIAESDADLTGKAIFVANDKTFVAWINHGDHLIFKSIQSDANIKKLYERIAVAGKIFDEHLMCVFNSKYGWLTSSPKILGNTLQISIFLQLVKLSIESEKLKPILNEYHLAISNVDSVTSADEGRMVCEIKNSRTLGLTEFQTIQEVSKGISAII